MGCLTAKASGTVASFISPTVTPIESARVYFSPTQLGEGTPSPENVREIVGRTSVELTHTGINLLGGEQLLENAKKHMPSMSDINTEEGWFKFPANINTNEQYTLSTNVRFKENTRYTFIITLLKSSNNSTNLRIYYTDGTYQHLTISVTGEKTTIRFVSKANKTVDYLRKFWGAAYTTIYYNECGVFEGVHSLDEFQHGVTSYQGTTIPFSWTNEIYGGYVDLVKGEIVETYKRIRLDANTPSEFTIQSNGLYTIWRYIDGMALGNTDEFFNDTKILCNSIQKVLSRGSIPTTQLGILFGNNSNNIYLYNMNYVYGYTTKEQISAWLDENPIYVTVPLATPITYPLPDYLKTQLQTLKNENTFWSDADSVEIEYGLAETFDIQKAKRKIIMNQPHVETVSGDAVSFTTDMKAPLKECKVSFMPVQEGEGDPSPTNVRNIVGWNEITGGLPSEYQEVEYIENTGEQYLLTDFIYRKDLDNPRIEWKYSQIVSPSGQDSMLFGYTVDGGAVYYECYNISTKIYGGVGGNRYSKIEITSSASLGNIAICSMTKTILQVNDNTYGYSGTYADLTTVNPMSIFAWTDKNGVSVNYINKGARLYYLRFLNNDTKMAEFIPCYRKSDGEIGMYDTVSKQFYTNQGTGTFLKGNDINNIFIDADFKSITELKNKFNGNITWNQLLPSTEKSGSHTPIGTQKYDTYRAILGERLIIGHIYFIWTTFTYNGDRTDIRPYMQQSTSQNYVRGGASRFFNLNGIGHEMEFGGFVNVTNDGNVILGITTNQANLTEEWSYDNLMLIDCTVAFGEEIANYYLNAPQYEAQAWFRNLFPDTYYEYNTGESIAKEFYWGDGITYGGYVDLVSGKLVDEWECVDLSTITPRVRYTGDVNKTISLRLPSSYLSYPLSSFKTMKCSMYKYIKSVTAASILSSPDKYDIGLYVYSHPSAPITSTVYFVLPIETQLSGYLTYCSSEPIVHQLTPQQLITLKGQNDLWIDSNETIDVKYWTH